MHATRSDVSIQAPYPDHDQPSFRLGRRSHFVGHWESALVIVVCGWAAYGNSLSGPFLFDDRPCILDNPSVRSLRTGLLPPQGTGVSGRPLLNFTLAVNYAMGGERVAGYHIFNLAIHLLAGLLLFGIVRRTLLLPKLRKRFGRHADVLALAVAVLWTVHPLQTSAVSYVIQRGESLMALCFLATLYCALRSNTVMQGKSLLGCNEAAVAGSESEQNRPLFPGGGRFSWVWSALAVTVCALGMATKEVMAVAPFVVLAFDRCCLSETWAEVGRRWRLHASLFATLGVLGLCLWQGGFHSGTTISEGATPGRYLATQCGVIVHYLRLAFRPQPLVFDYKWPLAAGWRDVWVEALLLALLAGVTIAGFVRGRPAAFLGVWFFVVLAPTSSILPIKDAAFEHRMYLPLAAVVIGVVLCAYRLLTSEAVRNRLAHAHSWVSYAPAVLVVALVVVLGIHTWIRNRDYRSEISIWSDTIAKRPANYRAYSNLGMALCRLGHPRDAMQVLNQALRLSDEKDPFAFNSRGVARRDLGRFAESVEDFTRAVQLRPEFVEAYNNRAASLAALGRYEQAIADLDRVSELRPEMPLPYSSKAELWERLKRYESARDEYSRLLSLKPDLPEAWFNRGVVQLELQAYGAAKEDFDRALILRPDYAEALVNRGVCFVRLGNSEQAVSNCTQAIQLQPRLATAYRVRAEAYLAAGEADLARRDRETANRVADGAEVFLSEYPK